MPIRHYLDGERFDPETTRLLGIAFEFAIQALHNWGVVDPPREAIARAIIGFARAGERDPERLCDLALEACSIPIITDPSPLPPPVAALPQDAGQRALRTSIGSRRRSVPFSSSRSKVEVLHRRGLPRPWGQGGVIPKQDALR